MLGRDFLFLLGRHSNFEGLLCNLNSPHSCGFFRTFSCALVDLLLTDIVEKLGSNIYFFVTCCGNSDPTSFPGLFPPRSRPPPTRREKPWERGLLGSLAVDPSGWVHVGGYSWKAHVC